MKNELALMAIKGGRYSEAEAIFNAEISGTPDYTSYQGLGICKLNMILDGNRSEEEVFYCFGKALAICPEEQKAQLERDIMAVCFNVIEQLTALYSALEEQAKKEANKAALGAALTIGAAMVGSGEGANAFTQISSLAVAGAGVGLAVDGIEKIGKIPDILARLVLLDNSIRNRLPEFIILEKSQLETSLKNYKRIKESHDEKARIEKENKAKKPGLILKSWVRPWDNKIHEEYLLLEKGEGNFSDTDLMTQKRLAWVMFSFIALMALGALMSPFTK